MWVNVRADAYPSVPALSDRDWVLWTTPGGQVTNVFYLGYLVRSYILTPDARTLLNESDGMLGQSEMGSNGYLPMLQAAVARWKVSERERLVWVARLSAASSARGASAAPRSRSDGPAPGTAAPCPRSP